MSEETPTKRPLEETEGAEKAEEKAADASSTEPVAKKTKVEDGAKAEGEDAGKEAETEGGTGQADEKPATEASAAVEPPKAALAPPPPAADTSGLPEVLNTRPATKAKLEWLFTTGKCTQAEMDQKIISSLCEFPDATGVQIVEHFAEADMSSIRNKCGYLAGVMKRFRSDARMFGLPASAALPPPPSFQGPPGGGMWPSVQEKLDMIFASGVVSRDDLDSRCLDQLKSLPEATALEVVTKYGEADLSSINSKAGFFMGIVKRFKEQVVASDPTLTNQAYQGLAFHIQSKLENLFSTNMVQRHELDAKCFMELRNLPEHMATEVVDKFCESNLSDIRNKTAFFLGIVKRFKNERGGGGAHGPPPGGNYGGYGAAPGGYGAYGGGYAGAYGGGYAGGYGAAAPMGGYGGYGAYGGELTQRPCIACVCCVRDLGLFRSFTWVCVSVQSMDGWGVRVTLRSEDLPGFVSTVRQVVHILLPAAMVTIKGAGTGLRLEVVILRIDSKQDAVRSVR